MSSPQDTLYKFQTIIQELQISPYYASKLKLVDGVKTVIIVDDSGSMNSFLKNPDITQPGFSRYQQLQLYMPILIKMANALYGSGPDVWFLNQTNIYQHVQNFEQLSEPFNKPIEGQGTPLCQTWISAMRYYEKFVVECPALFLIMTDGAPGDYNGQRGSEYFTHLLSTKPENVYINFVACTDNPNDLYYLNKLDRTIPNIDCTSDYRREYEEIKTNSGYCITQGDYIVKMFVGSFDPTIDNLDETPKDVQIYEVHPQVITDQPPAYVNASAPPAYTSDPVMTPAEAIPPSKGCCVIL